MTAIRLPSALFWIKHFHTVIFLVESAAILYIVYSGIASVGGTALVTAVLLVLAAIVVFLANGARCPLTAVARQMRQASPASICGTCSNMGKRC